MFDIVDNFLNKTTMYRVVLYVLFFFFGAALILSIFNLLPFSPLALIVSFFVILIVSEIINRIFAYLYNAPTNVESVYITALIIFFLINPPQLNASVFSEFLPLVCWASLFAVASKYILAIGRKHIFNPVAISMVLLAFILHSSANWWIGTVYMLPFVLFGGFLIVRKTQRLDLVLSFIISALGTMAVIALWNGEHIFSIFNNLALVLKDSAFLFFTFIMVTEPLTSPTTKRLRIAFGVLVGFLFLPTLHIGSYYSTPELALVIGNIFAYIVSPKEKLFLKLRERIQVSTDTFEFVFQKNQKNKKDGKFNFHPGQYMEWTLKHRHPDTRGNRRYFTLASSPTEEDIRLGVKFYEAPSSFKKELLTMPIGGEIVAAQRSGDFILPNDKDQELVFIAGGIGITPFRSMIQYLLDRGEKRQITLLYSNKKTSDIAYKPILDRAEKELGIKTIYAITDGDELPSDSSMHTGFIDVELIGKEIPDYANKTFYISGPHGMVKAFEKTLKSMGISKRNIKIDFFPGFA